jgi:hypothetical protein
MSLGPERLAGLTGILSYTATGVTSRGPQAAGGRGESRPGNARPARIPAQPESARKDRQPGEIGSEPTERMAVSTGGLRVPRRPPG